MAQRFDTAVLLARAAEVDLGFSITVLASMIRTLDRFTDEELPIDPAEVSALRAFFRTWATHLETS